MNLKIDEPSVPIDIQQEIMDLHSLLQQASVLRNDILRWYASELKSYHAAADPNDELFDPGTGEHVEGISYTAVMEGLSILQTSNLSLRRRH